MVDKIEKQIDDMLNIGNPTVTQAPFTEAVGTEAPGTKSPGTETPGTEAPGTKAPSTEAPGTKAPSTDAPATEAPTTEAPKDGELEKMKKENESLRIQLDEASKKKAPKTAAPTTAVPFKEVDFLGKDVDLEELTRDPSMLNKILNKVFKMGSEASRKFQETTLRNIPEIVKSNVVAQAVLSKQVKEFYDNNKDLKPFKKIVGAVYEELASENPDWKIEKMFEEVEKETRKRLELHKKAGSTEAPTTEAPKIPRFPKTKTSRVRRKPKTSHLLTEIDKMNENQ